MSIPYIDYSSLKLITRKPKKEDKIILYNSNGISLHGDGDSEIVKYLKDNNISCIVATHDKNDVLGFADQLLVIHQSKIIAKDTPQHIYRNPKLPIIASFFGEFNVIAPFGIVYANQIKIVEKSELKATVKTSYFNGNSWLIEAEHHSESLFIEHSKQIQPSQEIFLKINK